MKPLIRIVSVVVTLVLGPLLILAALGLLVFGLAAIPSREVATRVPSPDGRWVATVVETNGGASTSFGYDVTLQRVAWPHESVKVADLYGAIRNPDSYGVNVHWGSNINLIVEYMAAKRAAETNWLWLRTTTPIHITLHGGINDNDHRVTQSVGT